MTSMAASHVVNFAHYRLEVLITRRYGLFVKHAHMSTDSGTS